MRLPRVRKPDPAWEKAGWVCENCAYYSAKVVGIDYSEGKCFLPGGGHIRLTLVEGKQTCDKWSGRSQ